MPKAPFPMFFITSYLAKRDCARQEQSLGVTWSLVGQNAAHHAVHEVMPCVTHNLCCAVSRAVPYRAVPCHAVRCYYYATPTRDSTHLRVTSRRFRCVVPHEAEAEGGVRDLLFEALRLVLRADLVEFGVEILFGALGLGLGLWLGLGRHSKLTVMPNDPRRPPASFAPRGVRSCSTVFVSGSGLNSLLSLRLSVLSSLSPCREPLPTGLLSLDDDAGLCLGLSCGLSSGLPYGLRIELWCTKDELCRFSRCRNDGLLSTVRTDALSICSEVGISLIGLPALKEPESSLAVMAAAIRLSRAAFASAFASNRALILAAQLCDLTTVPASAGDAASATEAGEA